MTPLDQYLADQPDDLIHATARQSEVAYTRIKDALLHAGLAPGEPLSEPQLARLLGISRTPIREALQQLAQEGMIEIIPGRAVTVASRSLKDVLDVIHMRTLLEPEMMRLVAESATAEHHTELTTTIARMETAVSEGDYSAWSKADIIYHETMSAACPNHLLGETVLMLRNRVHHLANADSKLNPARLAACTAEHRQIVEAVIERDAIQAEAATREHLRRLQESMLKRMTYS
jgi:DNA-binding GntR family transcriptional regulator